MVHYIDKDALVAEIKRRRKLVSDPILSGDDLMIGERNALFDLLSFIDSLEVKDVNLQEEPASEDLEEEIGKVLTDYYGTCYDDETIAELSAYDIANIARHFANWQKQQMMKDAVEVTIAGDSAIILPKAIGKNGDKVKVIIIKED